ncbi:Nucleotidyltransferase domain-containing protein [Candidatus Electrothrix marina]|uniref:Nucleotidyltransferase domain-containing protein n=1 Tax=Candidatus Electrothrix marina TaxID=1859130 RepID=A0A444JF93_9BACT|nr:Nucleotidyltransferase domain-containing protein [Candidatus Electrothrix marina]
MDKEEVIRKLVQYKRLLSQYMSFDKMMLFGSYARGTQREDSDVDVAIIVDEIQGGIIFPPDRCSGESEEKSTTELNRFFSKENMTKVVF